MKTVKKLFIITIIIFNSSFLLRADAPSNNPVKIKKPCGLSDDMNCFENRKTAYADEVNANFKALYDRIQGLIEMECSYNYNKKLCPNSHEVFEFKAYSSELNSASARFSTSVYGRMLMVIPELSNGGWNPHSVNGDFGLIWTDKCGPNGNGNSGLVIGPHSNIAAGIRIKADGNVGIGIADPMVKLHVNGDATVMDAINCGHIRHPERMHLSGGDELYILNKKGVVISNVWGGNGNLSLDGYIRFLSAHPVINNSSNWPITVYSDLSISGDVIADNYSSTSDIRFKKDITPLSSPLTKTLALKPVYFKWKTNEFKEKKFSTKKQIGFIANDVETVIPESVYTDHKGIKYIDYGKITPVIVGAIQALNTKISNLEKENISLKKKLAEYDQLAQKIVLLEKTIKRKQIFCKGSALIEYGIIY